MDGLVLTEYERDEAQVTGLDRALVRNTASSINWTVPRGCVCTSTCAHLTSIGLQNDNKGGKI